MRDWLETEKIVQIIEKLISPHSTVEHNLKLPVIDSPNRKPRQCDVVIKTGKPPRETITIVEVQKRNSKVNINTFQGWVKKMEEVGAQHLICVSSKGFPDSVVISANKIGPAIRLVLLKELEEGKWPLSFFEKNIVQSNFIIADAKNMKIICSKKTDLKNGQYSFNFSDKVFYCDGNLVDMNQLIDPILRDFQRNNILKTNDVNIIPIKLPQNNKNIILLTKTGEVSVKSIIFDLYVNYVETLVPFQSSSYKQINYDDELAWLLEADVIINNIIHQIQLVFVPKDSRDYICHINLKQKSDLSSASC